ncbi:MAG TPA: metallophosphoesterase [Jatrophihabitantaceae bacterium]|nr:metallophosphoesterase [Jatrophihabitantaceae bacterium]
MRADRRQRRRPIGEAMSTRRWIAHLSDPHLDGTIETRLRVQAITQWLQQLRTGPDVVLVTGDLTEPSPESDPESEMAWLHQTLLQTSASVLLVRGNSDPATTFRAHLESTEEAYIEIDGQVHRRRHAAGMTFLLLDSTVPGSFAGRTAAGTCDWIKDEIASTDGPVVLALHHPPRELGHPVVDQLRAKVDPALAQIVEEEDRIVAIMCGHTHAAAVTTWAGKPLLIAPGTHSLGQVPPASDGSTTALIDETAPPGLMMHRIDGGDILTYIHAAHLTG